MSCCIRLLRFTILQIDCIHYEQLDDFWTFYLFAYFINFWECSNHFHYSSSKYWVGSLGIITVRILIVWTQSFLTWYSNQNNISFVINSHYISSPEIRYIWFQIQFVHHLRPNLYIQTFRHRSQIILASYFNSHMQNSKKWVAVETSFHRFCRWDLTL